MAETLLSPGVLTRENDQTLVTQGPTTAGAALLGPTVKGPVNIPTLVHHLVTIKINLVVHLKVQVSHMNISLQ